MDKISYGVYELTDGTLRRVDRPFNEVCWFSQHVLTEDQEKVLYYLHDKNVRIRHYNLAHISFPSTIACVNKFAQGAVVYAVLPNYCTDIIRRGSCDDVTYRTMNGMYDRDGGIYTFHTVVEHTVMKGRYQNKVVFTSSNLTFYSSREGVSPALGATARPVSLA